MFLTPVATGGYVGPVAKKMPSDSRRASVSVAGDGIEIGRLQIYMDKQRTSHIKNCVLEARFDEPSALDQTGSMFSKNQVYPDSIVIARTGCCVG